MSSPDAGNTLTKAPVSTRKRRPLKAANGYLEVTAREIAAQPGNRTHGQLRVTAFHPSVQKVPDYQMDEDGGLVWFVLFNDTWSQ